MNYLLSLDLRVPKKQFTIFTISKIFLWTNPSRIPVLYTVDSINWKPTPIEPNAWSSYKTSVFQVKTNVYCSIENTTAINGGWHYN